jgi:hypothetical protein
MLTVVAAVLGFLLLSERDVLFWIVAGHVLFAAFARAILRRNTPLPRNLAVVGTVLILVGCVLGDLYHAYKSAGVVGGWGIIGEAFRFGALYRTWPVYGSPGSSRWPLAVVALPAVVGLAWWLLGPGRRWTRRRPVVANLILAALAAFAFLSFGLSDRPERTLGLLQDEMFVADWSLVQDADRPLQAYGAELAGYIDKQYDPVTGERRIGDNGALSWFGAHYPPGLPWLHGAAGVWGSLLLLLTCAATGPTTYLAARSLELSPDRSWLAAAVLVASPMLLMMPTVSAGTATVPLAAAAVALCGRSLRGGFVAPLTLGLLIAGWSFLTFGVLLVAAALGITMLLLVVTGSLGIGRALVILLLAAGSLVSSLGLLYLATGYDTLHAWQDATANHFWQIGGRKLPPEDPLGRSLLRLLGNLFAFLIAHLPLTALALLALRRSRRPVNLLLIATWSAVLLANVSGTFILETERIWIAFLPLLAIPAATVLPRSKTAIASYVGGSLLLALLTEWLWRPYV